MSDQKTFRCAVYTRKSSEEGLEQDFNSLEAQREACEAYVRSQSHEGWKLIPDRFDDGGFSGGNMERPALGKLMAMIREGQVDIIVIYKIDRLTRSLTDFARLAETFDKHGVSFVSVTQQFNTTTSMGRLMLNVLLSFAQFEREITGERIRDKIAASKKKGMWMGGPIPMGYDVKDRHLVINEANAAIVRKVFEHYLEEGQVPALLERLDRERLLTAGRTSAKGRTSGSRSFTRGHLYKLLSNPIYIGRIAHKDITHPGQHDPILDRVTWEKVQAKLASNTQGERKRRSRAAALTPLLAGLLYSEAGNRMIPSHAIKAGRRYGYYVEEIAANATSSRSSRAESVAELLGSSTSTTANTAFTGSNRAIALRLPAGEIDAAVRAATTDLLTDEQRLLAATGQVDAQQVQQIISGGRDLADKLSDPTSEHLASLFRRIVVSGQSVGLVLNTAGLRQALGVPASNPPIDDPRIEVPLTFRRRGRQMKITMGGRSAGPASTVDSTLVTVVARAFDWFERLSTGAAKSVNDIAESDGFDAGYVSHVLPLAFMAPTEIENILAGRQRADLTADGLIWREDISLRWPQVNA